MLHIQQEKLSQCFVIFCPYFELFREIVIYIPIQNLIITLTVPKGARSLGYL